MLVTWYHLTLGGDNVVQSPWWMLDAVTLGCTPSFPLTVAWQIHGWVNISFAHRHRVGQDGSDWPLRIHWRFQFCHSVWLCLLEKRDHMAHIRRWCTYKYKYRCVCVCVCVCLCMCVCVCVHVFVCACFQWADWWSKQHSRPWPLSSATALTVLSQWMVCLSVIELSLMGWMTQTSATQKGLPSLMLVLSLGNGL